MRSLRWLLAHLRGRAAPVEDADAAGAAPYCRDTVVVSSPTVVTQPVVVQQPVVVSQPVATTVTQTQNVWVEGRYVDTIQANGSVLRTWSPGHYETRTVMVK